MILKLYSICEQNCVFNVLFLENIYLEPPKSNKYASSRVLGTLVSLNDSFVFSHTQLHATRPLKFPNSRTQKHHNPTTWHCHNHSSSPVGDCTLRRDNHVGYGTGRCRRADIRLFLLNISEKKVELFASSSSLGFPGSTPYILTGVMQNAHDLPPKHHYDREISWWISR